MGDGLEVGGVFAGDGLLAEGVDRDVRWAEEAGCFGASADAAGCDELGLSMAEDAGRLIQREVGRVIKSAGLAEAEVFVEEATDEGGDADLSAVGVAGKDEVNVQVTCGVDGGGDVRDHEFESTGS